MPKLEEVYQQTRPTEMRISGLNLLFTTSLETFKTPVGAWWFCEMVNAEFVH